MITDQLAKAKKANYDYYSNILVAMNLLNISPKKKKKRKTTNKGNGDLGGTANSEVIGKLRLLQILATIFTLKPHHLFSRVQGTERAVQLESRVIQGFKIIGFNDIYLVINGNVVS